MTVIAEDPFDNEMVSVACGNTYFNTELQANLKRHLSLRRVVVFDSSESNDKSPLDGKSSHQYLRESRSVDSLMEFHDISP